MSRPGSSGRRDRFRRMRLRSLTAGLTLLFALTACSGGAGSTAPAPATPADRLAAAKAAMDRAASVHLVLTSRDVPSAADGVLGADGVGTHAPAFKGRLDARISGIQAAVDVVSVGQRALPEAAVHQPVRAHRPQDLPGARPGHPVRHRQGGSARC